jgi:hypothetical protein
MKGTGNNNQSSGSEQIDHQHIYPAGGAGAASTLPVLPDNNIQNPSSQDQPSYFCRGCGKPLPSGFRGHFHAECLRADKRRRTRTRRAQEQKRFRVWLEKFACPHCGAKDGHALLKWFEKYQCEASQGGEAKGLSCVRAGNARCGHGSSSRGEAEERATVSVTAVHL